MSNQVNETLLTRASEMREYWVGSLWERLIEHAVESNDLEAVQRLVKEAEAEMRIQEDNPVDPLGPVNSLMSGRVGPDSPSSAYVRPSSPSYPGAPKIKRIELEATDIF